LRHREPPVGWTGVRREGVSGRVLGAGAPIADSTVTLWAASPGDPQQLEQTRTGADGRFEGFDPVSRRQGRPSGGEQDERRQPRHRPGGRGGRHAPGHRDHQRDDHCRLGMDSQSIHRRPGQGPLARSQDRRQQRAELHRSPDRRLGHYHPGPAQRQPDPDHGQLRHAGRCALRMHYACDSGCLPEALRGRDASQGKRADRYPDGGRGDRPLSLVPARARLRSARSALCRSEGQDDARRPVHALPEGSLPAHGFSR
jgi:hypothetical protein